MSNRFLLRGVGLPVLLNLSIKPAWVLIENIIHNTIGHEAWGRYASMFALVFMLSPIADVGLSQLLTRTIATNTSIAKSLSFQVLKLKIGLGLVFSLLCGGIGILFFGWDYSALKLVFALAILHWLLSMLTFWRALLQGLQRFEADGIAGIADKTMLAAVMLIAIYTNPQWITLDNFLYSSLITTFITAGFAFVIAFRYLPKDNPIAPQHNNTELLQAGIVFATLTVLFGVNERVSQWLVSIWSTDAEAGIFSGAYRWVSAFSMYLWTVLPIFYARFAAHAHETYSEQRKLLEMGQLVVGLPILLVCGFCWVYPNTVFFLFSNSSSAEHTALATSLQILCIGLFFNGVFNIYSTWLTATGREKGVNLLLIPSIILNVLLNALLCPHYGAQGAAIAHSASFIVLSAGFVLLCKNSLYEHLPILPLLKILVLAAVFSLSLWGMSQYSTLWVLNIIVALLLTGGFFWRLQLLPVLLQR